MEADKAEILLRQFNETLQQWIAWLDDYSFATLLLKPRPGAWSLGQMYIHLLVSTEHFIKQSRIAAATDENGDKPMQGNARSMFARNSFPDKVMEGPDNDGNIPQPDSKAQIASGLIRIREEINRPDLLTGLQHPGGKTRHPGLHYFSAPEWLQFAEMHLRHHYRQRQRIERQLAELSDPEKKP